MKKMLNRSVLTAIAAVSALACGFDDDPITGVQIPGGSAVISADITTNRTLYAETTYTISGFVKVASGATLTIRPGTRILGDYNILGSSLFVLRGARIEANGTADAPIVFTSSRPEGQRQAGDWGGLILIGRGIINRGDPTIIEGTGVGSGNPAQNYASGTDNADNSGILRYVRVEFAGYATAQDQELNSFTFAAVGSGTTAEYLQTLNGLDDSFEWFGGAVNHRYLVSYESGDDHFDASEGYTGRVQYAIAYQTGLLTNLRSGAGTPSSDPQGVENDGCNGSNCSAGHRSNPMTDPMFANFTLVGPGTGTGVDGTSGGWGLLLRRGTAGYYVNSVVARWPKGAASIRDSVTGARIDEGTLVIRNMYLAENGAVFEAGSQRYDVDQAANVIEVGAGTAAGVFTSLPAGQPGSETELDWSLVSGAEARIGGTGPFTGALATKAAGLVTGTTFRGAWDPNGTKWWQGWTRYARN
ncbi:MAG TPA: hypothetical protein VMM17_01905 [Gemmatimonadaceae bacterium]|nr:hypothetical protein [Gemmatimonadaceae bacterium]